MLSSLRGVHGPHCWVFGQPPEKGGSFLSRSRIILVVGFGGGAGPELCDRGRANPSPQVLTLPAHPSLVGKDLRVLVRAALQAGNRDRRGSRAEAALGRRSLVLASLLHLRSASRPGGVCLLPSLRRGVLSASWSPVLTLPVHLPAPHESLPAPSLSARSFLVPEWSVPLWSTELHGLINGLAECLKYG